MAKMISKEQVMVNGEPITVCKVDYDVNGNARYVVHFLSLGIELKDYGRIPGLTKYRAKWYGGGYVFQSVNLQHDLEWMQAKVKEHYAK